MQYKYKLITTYVNYCGLLLLKLITVGYLNNLDKKIDLCDVFKEFVKAIKFIFVTLWC